MRSSFILLALLVSLHSIAQEMSARSNEIPLDLSRKGEIQNGSVPQITWLNPSNETTNVKTGDFKVRFEVVSKQSLKYVFLFVRNKETRELKSSTALALTGPERRSTKIEKLFSLDESTELEILAENESGFKCISRRELVVSTKSGPLSERQ